MAIQVYLLCFLTGFHITVNIIYNFISKSALPKLKPIKHKQQYIKIPYGRDVM